MGVPRQPGRSEAASAGRGEHVEGTEENGTSEPEAELYLNCPCGAVVEGSDEDDLVTNARVHLEEVHPGRTYTREQILFMAS